MAKEIISQGTRIEPVRVEAYRCPIEGCGEVLVGSYEEAVAHVNQPIALRFPIGFTFNEGNGYFVIRQDNFRLTLNHSPSYYVCFLSPRSMPNRVLSFQNTDSLSVVETVRRNSLLIPEQLEGFGNFHADFFKQYNLTPVRTTPELEAMLGASRRG